MTSYSVGMENKLRLALQDLSTLETETGKLGENPSMVP